MRHAWSCDFTRRLWRATAANVAVEFALVAPIFVLLIVGIVDYGVAARDRSALDAAARTGLQVLLADSENVVGAEDAAAAVAPDASVDAQVSCVCVDGAIVDCDAGTCASGAPKRFITVTVTQDHPLMFPWPGFDDPMELSAVATARAK